MWAVCDVFSRDCMCFIVIVCDGFLINVCDMFQEPVCVWAVCAMFHSNGGCTSHVS